jgi:hypothetical protein
MISPSELREYLAVMREAGCLVFKDGETVIHLGPPKFEGGVQNMPIPKDDYRDLLFAATEGLPEEGGAQQ